MREVGNTQVEGDGRLQTMLADPEELPAGHAPMPAIPRPPPGQGARGKKGAPVALIVIAILGLVALAAFGTVLALGYTIEVGDYAIGIG